MLNWLGKKHQQILDNMADGVYFVNPDGEIQYWNRGAESLTGFSADDIVGKIFAQLPLQREDAGGGLLQQYEHPVSLCLQEKKIISRNFFMVTKDERKIPVEENVSPLYKDGKMAGVIATFRDITRCVKTVESQLRTEKKERLIPICGWCKKIKSDENYWE
ncbi:MAG: PAS domain S-box protein, partial [Nitrospiraceae bacterium]